MKEMIHERQTAEKVERHDLFSNLLEANNNELDVTSLTEDELIGKQSHTAITIMFAHPPRIGNIYIFLVAGHEVGRSSSSRSCNGLRLFARRQHILCVLLLLYWPYILTSKRNCTNTFDLLYLKTGTR